MAKVRLVNLKGEKQEEIKLNDEIFGIVPNKNVLYEGAYINNTNDMYWYYTLENYKMLSEAKK